MIITKTPLRISLLGGNTDLPEYYKKYGGAVITTTIDKYIYCIVKKRFDKQIWINYSKKEIVNNVDDIKHDLVREALKMVGITEGIEISFMSDVPSEGSGLGSSSAVTVGLLNALHAYKGDMSVPFQLSVEACYIEIDVLKKPIGVQDQFAVAYGGCKKFKFMSKNIEYMPLSDHFEKMFKDSLLLLYTGKTRKAEKILSKMRLNKRILDKNKNLVNEGVTAMSNYTTWRFGELLDEYWQLKKKLNPLVTNKFIDEKYQQAMDLEAYGGKIVGAGGGGFLLLVMHPRNRNLIKQALRLQELEFNLSRRGSEVIYSDE